MTVFPYDLRCLGTDLSPQAVWWRLRTPSLSRSLGHTWALSRLTLKPLVVRRGLEFLRVAHR